MGIVIRVPLQAHLRCLHRRPPSFTAGMVRLVEARGHRLRQNAVEEFTAKPQTERRLLALLGAPAGAIHHPEEIRLDPAHPSVGEAAAEFAVLDGMFADRWWIGLVDHDGFRVMVSKNMLPLSGPAADLVKVTLGRKMHGLSTGMRPHRPHSPCCGPPGVVSARTQAK